MVTIHFDLLLGLAWAPKRAPFGPFWRPRRSLECQICFQPPPIGPHGLNHTHRIDIGPFCGGQGPNLVQKGAFWAKAGPFRPPPGPVETRYQAKVCGDHESSPG